MEFKKIFDDTKSEQLYKQLHDAQSYVSDKLEKHISKELLLRVLEKNLLPVIVYPEKDNNIMPMWYGSSKNQITTHTPKPEVQLLTVEEWHSFTGVGGDESFYEMIVRMMDNVKKLDG